MKSSWRDLLDWLWKFIEKLLIAVVAVKNTPTPSDKIVRKEIDTNDPEMAVGHETQIAETPVQEAETFVKNEQSANTLSISDEDVYPGADSDMIEKKDDFETEGVNVEVDTLNNETSAAVTEVNTQKSNDPLDVDHANVNSVSGESVQSNDSELENKNSAVEDENVGDSERTVTFALPKGNESVAGTEHTEDASDVENFLSDYSNIETVFSDSGNVETVSADNSNAETVASDNSNVETASAGANNLETVPSGSGASNIENDRTNFINEDDACGYYENYDSNTTQEQNVSWLLDLSSKTAYHEILAPQYYSLNFKTAAELRMESVQTVLKQLRRLIPLLGLGLRRRKKDMWICLYPEDQVDYPIIDEDKLWNIINTAREQFNYMENGCLSTFRLQKSHPCTQCQTPVAGTETSPASSLSNQTILACSSGPDAATSERTAPSDRISGPTSSRTANMVTDETNVDRIPNAFDSDDNDSTAVKGFSKDKSEQLDSSVVPNPILPSDVISNGPSYGVCHSENEMLTNSIVNNTSVSSKTLVKDCKETKSMSYSYRLIFGIPRPLAGETLAKHICDTFIKELNQVISGTCEDTLSSPETNSSHEINDNQTGLQNNCDTVVPSSNCDNGATTTENGCEQGNGENSEQSEAVRNSDRVNEIDSDAIMACMQPQITAIESAFTSHENILHEMEKSSSHSNNPEAVDRNSPYIERRLEESYTKNFLNKCKTLRVNFVSGFATCVNVAVADCLVKYGCSEEDQDVKIGYSISVHYSFEDLSEYEWKDSDNSNDDIEEVPRIDCCMPATVTLNSKPCNWQSKFWERVQLVHKNWLAMVGLSPNNCPLKIPLGMDSEVKEENFAPICHPGANISIATIQNQAKEYPIQLDHIESTSYQEISPIIIFLRTNNITLNLSENSLRFTYYNQGQFVPHNYAHDFADDILSILKKSISL